MLEDAFRFSLLIGLATPLFGQLGGGTIQGVVSDGSGAAVPGALIAVTNTKTNVPYRTKTNAEGFYTTPTVAIGEYTVTAGADGFKKVVRTGISLAVDQTARVDMRLEVGDVNQSVEVVADASLVNTATSTAGKVVGEREISDLPLNGRNAFSMVYLTPGVISNGGLVDPGFGSRGNDVADISINGGVNGTNNFTMDGGNNTSITGNEVSANPSVDAIAEFKVQSNTMSAEYGFTLGGVVNVATKSGTNAYHGTAYEFLRNNVFDSRNAFSVTTPYIRYDQFGGTWGGPVRIPKIFDGRNRTFFFFNYEGYREHTQTTSYTTVPTLAERQGDFSHDYTVQGALIAIYDPTTTMPNPKGSGAVRQPFPNNIIPVSQIDPVSSKLLPFVAQPNTTPINAFTQQNNFYNVSRGGLQSDQLTTRVDEHISDRNQFRAIHGLLPSSGTWPGWRHAAADLGTIRQLQDPQRDRFGYLDNQPHDHQRFPDFAGASLLYLRESDYGPELAGETGVEQQFPQRVPRIHVRQRDPWQHQYRHLPGWPDVPVIRRCHDGARPAHTQGRHRDSPQPDQYRCRAADALRFGLFYL
jgi:hypothetical protein